MLVTHIFSLFVWVGLVLLIIAPKLIRIDHLLPPNDGIQNALFALWVAVSAILTWIVVVPMTTWLYVFVFRKTVLSFKEAKEFTPIFFINKSGRWYPMKELTDVPPEERINFLRNFIQKNNLGYRTWKKRPN